MMDIPKALKKIRPDALYYLDGDEYAGLHWMEGNETEKPTEQELLEAWRLCVIDKVKSELHSKMNEVIEVGIIWAWSAEESEYSISLDSSTREMLNGWAWGLTKTPPITSPHKGFIKSNGVKIYGPGGIDIPDAALLEICEFSLSWVTEISQIRIVANDDLEALTLEEIEAYNVCDVSWAVTWDAVAHPDWSDNKVLYNP